MWDRVIVIVVVGVIAISCGGIRIGVATISAVAKILLAEIESVSQDGERNGGYTDGENGEYSGG